MAGHSLFSLQKSWKKENKSDSLTCFCFALEKEATIPAGFQEN